MTVSAFIRRTAAVAAAISLVSVSGLAHAQASAQQQPYEPSVGQAGKDVVWVPTPQSLVDKMLDIAQLKPGELLMDLGSGDGRTVITAAKRGARALGIEYNPDMVELSKANARAAGVTDRAQFMKADRFETDFSKATEVTMFLLPDINLKLRPKLLTMKPGTRVVSNTFTMGDWEPDEKATVEPCESSWCNVLFWVVPARVAGQWKLPQGELTLKQHYQMISGTFRTGGKALPVQGKVTGAALAFKAGGKEYRGRLNGRQLELTK